MPDEGGRGVRGPGGRGPGDRVPGDRGPGGRGPGGRDPDERATEAGRASARGAGRNRILLVAALVVVLGLLVATQLRGDDLAADDGVAVAPDASSENAGDDPPSDEPSDGEGPNGDDAGGPGSGTDGEAAPGAGGTPADDADSAASLPHPAPDATDPDTSAAAARATLMHYLARADLAYASPERAVDLQGTASGSAASEVEAVVSEFASSGLRQRGEVQVLEADLEDAVLDGDPPSLTLLACLDASQISVIDADGEVVRPRTPGSRSLHRYDLVHQEERWRIVRHDLPDDADC